MIFGLISVCVCLVFWVFVCVGFLIFLFRAFLIIQKAIWFEGFVVFSRFFFAPLFDLFLLSLLSSLFDLFGIDVFQVLTRSNSFPPLHIWTFLLSFLALYLIFCEWLLYIDSNFFLEGGGKDCVNGYIHIYYIICIDCKMSLGGSPPTFGAEWMATCRENNVR